VAVILVIRKIGKLAEVRAGVIEVKSGNLSYRIPVNEDERGPKTDIDKLASDINHISEATNAAVQNEIKNQRLKTDLISNVSHDLKTPLTSMISYLDILEKEGLDSEDAPAHLAIVREKTERLKTLTEELFEAAKASSGNIPCEIETIDLSALIDQSLAEMGDRLSSKSLDIRKKISTDNTKVLADGKLLYRVLENLLSNISKYALEGSRVYIDVSKVQASPGLADTPDKLLLEVKNISRDELNISPDELMERFTRGDQSRNTEGSGLGLAIAKDLTSLMGGVFDITIDGDMFKASVLLNEAK
jgi:signal transduction histidine kinase